MLKAPGESVLILNTVAYGHLTKTVRKRLKSPQLDQPLGLQQGVEVQIRG